MKKKTEKQIELPRENDGTKPMMDPAAITRIVLGPVAVPKRTWWQRWHDRFQKKS